ncbi:acyl carrier protein [Bacillus chungangensis]|uniref:Acyl carrier protein n=1 Tax=Bacillus chungangensis TaxID=587633 RepID=A0ABT9WNG1_9BACI|nr:acyl carrier protein [Bacillus chungangensis]MDQ0174823.1 acyl carrier protein [Bacillus chungangensis]
MTKEEIFQIGKEVILEKLAIKNSEIHLTSSLKNDLGADSLDVVELVMELEDKFELEIPDEDAKSFITVENVIDYIHRNIQEKSEIPT